MAESRSGTQKTSFRTGAALMPMPVHEVGDC